MAKWLGLESAVSIAFYRTLAIGVLSSFPELWCACDARPCTILHYAILYNTTYYTIPFMIQTDGESYRVATFETTRMCMLKPSELALCHVNYFLYLEKLNKQACQLIDFVTWVATSLRLPLRSNLNWLRASTFFIS